MSAATRYGLTVCGLLLAVGFAALSNWQFSRGEQKRDWLDRVDVARAASPRSLAGALLDPATQGLPVSVEGVIELRASPRLLLDNQQREGRVGLREYVLTRQPGSDAWLLADLGWLPWPAERRLPELAVLPATLEARGLLTDLPGQGLRLAANPVIEGDAALLSYLDVGELSEQIGLRILPRLLRLDPALQIGHARDLNVLPNTLPPEKHRGYALQWAGLSLATVVITFLLFFRSRA